MNRGFLRASAAVLALAATAACAPVTSYNGFIAERNNPVVDPQVGVDTRTTVQQRFGSPSTTSALNETPTQTTWYYVSSVQERTAFFHPETTQRQVMAVRFEGDSVAAVDKYGLERGRVVSYDSHITPTRGRELGLLEQLLGNVGRSAPGGLGRDDQNGPGGGRDTSRDRN